MFRQAQHYWEKQDRYKMADLGGNPCPPESVELLKDTIECDDDQTIPHVFVVMGASVCIFKLCDFVCLLCSVYGL